MDNEAIVDKSGNFSRRTNRCRARHNSWLWVWRPYAHGALLCLGSDARIRETAEHSLNNFEAERDGLSYTGAKAATKRTPLGLSSSERGVFNFVQLVAEGL